MKHILFVLTQREKAQIGEHIAWYINTCVKMKDCWVCFAHIA